MKRGRWIGAIVALASSWAASARAQDATAPTLGSTDFTLTLARTDASGDQTVLDVNALATYFSLARCACPSSVVAGLTLSSDAAANLGTHTVDAQFFVGQDCDVVTTTTCTSVGPAVTLDASQLSTSQSLSTAAIFAAAGDAGCAMTTTSSTRLWAIVRLDGTRLTTEPSLALTLGGAGPAAPTAVTLEPADDGLLVSWTPSGDATTLQGHQVFCSPGAATASAASYDTCPAAAPDGGVGPFATLDPKLICSGLVAVGTNSVRVHGLTNGTTYDIAVVAVGLDGTPSSPSTAAQGTPGPTVGLSDLYKQDGGTAQAGCDVGGGWTRRSSEIAALAACIAFVVARRRRRARAAHRATGLFVLVVVYLVARPARADGGFETPLLSESADPGAAVPSPHAWNLELRFGPYRPDVDSEFAARGSAARPFQQLFGSSSHLMSGLEIDRQLFHRGGTWAIGLGAGYYHATAPALASDLKSPSGDETGLRLIPLSASLVYRADLLHERYGSPLVPYAKLGLDCTLWRMTDTSQPNVDGRTFGWHAAAGVTLDLSILDPEAARTMDRESGVNQTALFFEVARDASDGLGSSSALHVGDTTWFAGLMLEL